jgi:hypothetical protein
MKNFKKFLEEITIKGNPGVPGEGQSIPGESKYLSNIERSAKQRLELTGREHPPQIGGRMWELMEQSARLTAGKEDQLEKLAEDVILDTFGDLLDGVILDIKLVRPGENKIQELMLDMESDDDDEEKTKMQHIKDEELKMKIHKAKLANTIIQGEAKNTKTIIHSEFVKDGLRRIFGNKFQEVFNVWDELSKLAEKMDWIIPINVKADMMERVPEGSAGAVKVEWKPKKSDDEGLENAEDILNKISNDINNLSNDEMEELSNEISEFSPKITALGKDFPMLIHETVKGIFELIAAVSLPSETDSPEEIRKAQTVKFNVSSFEDEAEDFRTGPEIAADFRDFVNKNIKSDKYPNLRAYVFGYMMDPSKLSDSDFLKLFRGILNKTQEARIEVDRIVDEVTKDLDEYELNMALSSDIEVKGGETEIDAISRMAEEPTSYDKMSQREIQKLIDQALDEGDYEKVRQLSTFLKEGRLIYLKELEKINERKKYKL